MYIRDEQLSSIFPCIYKNILLFRDMFKDQNYLKLSLQNQNICLNMGVYFGTQIKIYVESYNIFVDESQVIRL